MERGSKGWPPTANQVREMLSGQSPSANLKFNTWMRHLHYTHNLEGEPPPPAVKESKTKGPTVCAVMTKKDKEEFLYKVGL